MNDTAQRPSYQQVKAMIKQFTGQANTLVIPRVFITFTGDHLAALLLNQILYWSERTSDADGWFYKTAEEWETELGMSGFQVKRAAAILSKFGVETKVRKVKTTPKMHYRIDMPLFTDLILKFLESQEPRNSTSYTLENQETSKSMEVEETSKSYKEHRLHTETTNKGGDDAPAKSPDELALAIADVCKINPKIATEKQRKALNATYQSLKAIGAAPADVKAREAWWYSNDWRAKKEHLPPRPDELLEIWEMVKGNGQAPKRAADLPLVTATGPTQTPEERKQAAERRRKIIEETRARNAS